MFGCGEKIVQSRMLPGRKSLLPLNEVETHIEYNEVRS